MNFLRAIFVILRLPFVALATLPAVLQATRALRRQKAWDAQRAMEREAHRLDRLRHPTMYRGR